MSFASSGIVIPLCLPEISKTLNISLSQGGAMETARTFIILAVLLISGILANRWGEKTINGNRSISDSHRSNHG